MKRSRKEAVIRDITIILVKYSDYPPELIADRIYMDILEKALQDQKDEYERLFFVDSNKQH